MSTRDKSSEKISQASIKNENTLAIFGEISKANGISRAEISAKTGLSLMTVGKVADTLTGEGIITQAKPATGSAGRRAGMLTVSDRHFILTFDISGAKFRATAMNLRAEPIDTVIYPYNDSLFPEDNLVIFFREASPLLMKHLMDKKLVGTGICIPGEYDEVQDTIISPRMKQLDAIKISANMKKAIGLSPDKIMNSVTAAASSELSELPEDKSGCAVSLTLDGGICGCIAIDGRVLPRPADFESLICENGKTLLRNLTDSAESTDEEKLCRHIGFALRPIISVFCPDSIFICSSERVFSEWFEGLLQKELKSEHCKPDIFFENGKKIRSDAGIAELIRDEMIRSL